MNDEQQRSTGEARQVCPRAYQEAQKGYEARIQEAGLPAILAPFIRAHFPVDRRRHGACAGGAT